MAQIFNTYGEWYQGLTSPATEKSYDVSGDMAQATPAATAQSEAAPAAAQAPEAPKTEPTIFKAPPANGPNIFGGLSSGAQSQVPKIAELGKAFKEQAGPSRTFESLGGTAPLQQAVEKGEGIDVAKGMLSAQYKGPQALEQTEAVNIENMLKGFQGQAEASRTLPGAMDLLSSLSPSATPGKLRQEALRRMSTPGYKAEAQEAKTATGAALGALNVEKKRAADLAAQRKAEEDAIRNLSRSYVQGRQSTLGSELDQAVAAEKAKQEQAAGLFSAFQGTGDRSKLTELEALTGGLRQVQAPEEALQARIDEILGADRYAELAGVPELVENTGPGKKSKFAEDWYNTTGQKLKKGELKRLEALARERQRELTAVRANAAQPDTLEQLFAAQDIGQTAKDRYAAMLADPKYAAIADVPPLELTISKHGQRSYQRPKGLNDKQWKLAWQRQQELESVFGSQTRGDKADFTGELQSVMPLNFEGPAAGIEGRVYQSQDINQPDYLRLEQGMAPTRQSVGTVEQKQQFNRINDLLDEADRLQETDPAASTKLLADVDKYLADQEAELATRGQGIEEKQQEWINQVRKARRKYRKTRAGLAGIGTVVGNTLGKMGVPQQLRGPLLTAGLTALAGPGAATMLPKLPGGAFLPILAAEKSTLGV